MPSPFEQLQLSIQALQKSGQPISPEIQRLINQIQSGALQAEQYLKAKQSLERKSQKQKRQK